MALAAPGSVEPAEQVYGFRKGTETRVLIGRIMIKGIALLPMSILNRKILSLVSSRVKSVFGICFL